MSGGRWPEIFPIEMKMKIGGMCFWRNKKDEGFVERADVTIKVYDFIWYRRGVYFSDQVQSWN